MSRNENKISSISQNHPNSENIRVKWWWFRRLSRGGCEDGVVASGCCHGGNGGGYGHGGVEGGRAAAKVVVVLRLHGRNLAEVWSAKGEVPAEVVMMLPAGVAAAVGVNGVVGGSGSRVKWRLLGCVGCRRPCTAMVDGGSYRSGYGETFLGFAGKTFWWRSWWWSAAAGWWPAVAAGNGGGDN
nr:hypothetical protein [Tanacetum cinerariifolium]